MRSLPRLISHTLGEISVQFQWTVMMEVDVRKRPPEEAIEEHSYSAGDDHTLDARLGYYRRHSCNAAILSTDPSANDRDVDTAASRPRKCVDQEMCCP